MKIQVFTRWYCCNTKKCCQTYNWSIFWLPNLLKQFCLQYVSFVPMIYRPFVVWCRKKNIYTKNKKTKAKWPKNIYILIYLTVFSSVIVRTEDSVYLNESTNVRNVKKERKNIKENFIFLPNRSYKCHTLYLKKKKTG